MTYKEFIFRAIEVAMRGMEPNQSVSLDATIIAESLVPDIFQAVGAACAGDERKRSLLRRNLTLQVTSGTTVLPTYALTKYMEDATLYDPLDSDKEYSWIRKYHDFVRETDDRYGYFTMQGGSTYLQREPGEQFVADVGLQFDGDMILSIPCIPERPATADDPVEVNEEVASELVTALAEALRGEIVRRARARS